MTVVSHIIRRFPGLDTLSWDAAAFVLKIVSECSQHKRIASIVLAGGTTPRILYESLARDPFKRMISWQDVHLFWGDERVVSPESPDSNYFMVRHALIDTVPIPGRNIHHIPTGLESADHNAREYERELRSFFPGHVPTPPFDLAILGMGADGHTASLFPGDPAIHERVRWVVPVTAPSTVKPRSRITLTIPALNSARYILLIAARPGKEQIIDAIQQGYRESRDIPATMLSPREELRFYIADRI